MSERSFVSTPKTTIKEDAVQTAEIQFKNLSEMTQLGVEPGEEGSAQVTREEAERLRDRGAIKIIGDDTIAPVEDGEEFPEPTPPGVPDPPELIKQEEEARGEGGESEAEETTDEEPETDKRGRGGRGR
jgi:hypothetical protein